VTWSTVLLLLSAPFIGSFLGILVDRLPEGRSIARPRSACDHCGRQLSARDLIPLVGWLVQGGRCRSCGGPIDRLYPILELASLLVAAWSLAGVPGWLTWPTAVLGWTLLTIAAIDLRHLIIPDELTLPLVPLGLVIVWRAGAWPLWSYAAASLAALVVVWGLRWAYARLRHREGIGLGDAKLMAAAGAWVGLDGLPSVLLLASVFGLLHAWIHTRIARPGSSSREIPFGPWIAAAFWLTWLYGPLRLV